MGYFFPLTAFVVSCTVYIFFLLILIPRLIDTIIGKIKVNKKYIFPTVAYAFTAAGMTPFLCFIITSPESFLRNGFDGPVDSGGMYWFLFLVDNIGGVIFLDFFDVFDISFSGITPRSWYAELATLFLRLQIGLVAIELIYAAYKGGSSTHKFYGTIKMFIEYANENGLNSKQPVEMSDINGKHYRKTTVENI